ncbi:alpha/beta hydrolase [Cognatishimia sp. 1_MG-2023]|uniref:alpha/beta fold hydrolase n=1 Tax=Cognatishimia sp. 1_MG-2023 TaxID=3062642 RepID=UPI0026E3D883|nr:alpha/beta hydrolase [Cognatishimia sp. 1_MG-2023]MDO6728270.1 alpha/beta hydrolase [Cognatishimia sp. 1_MG-2023]
MEFSYGKAQTSDGETLVYKTAGDGPVNVIFMGGWGCTKDYYDETLALLSLEGLRILIFDLRGQGESSERSGNYTSERQAQDVLDVADAAGMETFVAIGQSMGAKYVQHVPILAPKRVSGLILVAGCPAGAIDIADSEIAEIAGYAGSRDAMRETHHAMITQPIPHATSELWIKQAAEISHTVLFQTLNHCFRDDFEQAVIAATMPPTLIVGAIHDKFFPVEMMQTRVTQIISGAREVYLDCGHEIPSERPSELAIAIESFVAGQAIATA